MNAVRIVTAALVIIGSGLLHGFWTNRWGPSHSMVELAARMESVPTVIGEWTGKAIDVAAIDRAVAGVDASLARRYSHRTRGVAVTVIFVVGLPGKISTHTPDVCYQGAGFVTNSIAPFECQYGPDNRRALFQTAMALRDGPPASALKIFWSWNSGEGWMAPTSPRWEFSDKPVLTKLYVVRESVGADNDLARDPSVEFLRDFLPELDRVVFSIPKKGAGSTGSSVKRDSRTSRLISAVVGRLDCQQL
jgi:hypothetical protein